MTTGYYKPTYIKAYQTGLVQSRPDFLLPEDAFPILENAFLWRERIKRKPGYRLLGRLRRCFETAVVLSTQASGASYNNADILADASFNLRATEPNAEIEKGSVQITVGALVFLEADPADGTLSAGGNNTGTINYATGELNLSFDPALGAAADVEVEMCYFPRLPTMGLRSRELNNINFEELIAFDQKYAYRFLSGFEEFIPGTTWTGNDSDFFWSTNYWVGDGNQKIFWVTNFSGTAGDPIRYTNGSSWINFSPQIDAAGNQLHQCLAIVPFRGRMVSFNTFEGMTLGASLQFRQRIRWAAIGTPFTVASAIVNSGINANAWRDDIPGQGGFLDIPTAEDITAIGFVRDNLVIFCERSTWQLRYTGRSIAPFQIEKVNTELGAESTFSAVQFDTSLVGIGDKGVVECDSYKSERIDIKIPDLVYRFSNDANGIKRVHGIRDFQQRIAYWTYPESETGVVYPNRRLLYNYENDSWAIFKDTFTALGFFQNQQSLRWIDFPSADPDNQWQEQDTPWINKPSQFPAIVGGNHQGFVEFLGQSNFEEISTNDFSLSIKNITGNTTSSTRINSPSHNLETGQIITIGGIPEGTDFDNLNGGIFYSDVIDANNIDLFVFSEQTQTFSSPQLDPPGTYVGGGMIAARDNFSIVSKKFNYLEQGHAINFGFMDILMNSTANGEITLNVYTDYNDTEPVNRLPQNNLNGSQDTFFNSSIPTSVPIHTSSEKAVQRVYCPVRGSFIALQFTFSDAQMNGDAQEKDVEIDSQVIYTRPAGRQLTAF